jgi:hypothetical protein
MNNAEYKERVRLLLELLPCVSKIENFAIHGGTAINLFVLDLPRYSVDIDLTYIPIQSREETFSTLKLNLDTLKENVKKLFPRIVITSKPNKILCSLNGILVKIEVNGTKRGLIESPTIRPLCKLAQKEFNTFCEARVVSVSQLYGGKISAALDRQHPRDLFDIKLMFDLINDFDDVRKGFFYSLLGGDRPLIESLAPNRINQSETLVKQFSGMTDIPFSYNDFEETREHLIEFINSNLTTKDKEFLIDFENGNTLTKHIEYQEYLQFPSVQWKLQNINKLKNENPKKLLKNTTKLENWLLKPVTDMKIEKEFLTELEELKEKFENSNHKSNGIKR